MIFGETLVELGGAYPRLVVLDADVGASTQTALFRDAYPNRFYQIGIAEANMVGIAAGLSTQGWIPFVSTFAIFLTKRAGDQVRNTIAYPRANVKLNGAYGGLPTGLRILPLCGRFPICRSLFLQIRSRRGRRSKR